MSIFDSVIVTRSKLSEKLSREHVAKETGKQINKHGRAKIRHWKLSGIKITPVLRRS